MTRAAPILVLPFLLLAGSLLTGDGGRVPLRDRAPAPEGDPGDAGPPTTAVPSANLPDPPESVAALSRPPVRETIADGFRSADAGVAAGTDRRSEAPEGSGAGPPSTPTVARIQEAERRSPASDRTWTGSRADDGRHLRTGEEPPPPTGGGAVLTAHAPAAGGSAPASQETIRDTRSPAVDPSGGPRNNAPTGSDRGGNTLPAGRRRTASSTVEVGGLLELVVEIDSRTGVTSAPFHLLYPPDRLEFVGGRGEGFLGPDDDVLFLADGAPGRLFVALTAMNPGAGASGQGNLCRLSFRALQAGRADIRFEDAHLFADPRREIAGRFLPAAVEILPAAAGDREPQPTALAPPPAAR